MMEKKGNPLVVPCAGAGTVGDDDALLDHLIWLKDGSQIAMGQRNGSEWEITPSSRPQQNTVSSEDFSLSITQSRLSDSGMYICKGVGSTNDSEIIIFEEQTRVIINGEFCHLFLSHFCVWINSHRTDPEIAHYYISVLHLSCLGSILPALVLAKNLS